MASAVESAGIALMGLGGYLLWFSIHYWRDQAVVWPTTPIKQLLTGNNLPAPTETETVGDLLASQQLSLASYSSAINAAAVPPTTTAPPATGTPGTPTVPGTPGTSTVTPPTSTDVDTAVQQLATQMGWDATQVADWEQVIADESGGNPEAVNAASGALGIAQALGHGTADTAGTLGNEYGGYGLTTAQAVAANSGNAEDQLLWMANYIKATYGTPSGALASENENHYY
jgi:hypothetical protein